MPHRFTRDDDGPTMADQQEQQRAQSFGEEIANAVSHGAGLAASLVALPFLVITAFRRQHDAWQVVAWTVYGLTLALLYAASTIYHALPAAMARAKRLWRTLDHGAIYLLIAGTYTPFALGALRGRMGWTLLTTIWSLAVAGIAFKAGGLGFRWPRLSTVLYLAMGWLAVVALRPLATAIGPGGLAWLFGGGVCYTAGVIFYSRDHRIRYGHFVWHLFVLGGSACHLVAVAGYAAGR